jgi:hypothetical protein
MPKLTLLDMTQRILSDMDGDAVNSITDTDEALQVAGVIRDTFYDLVSNETVPEHLELFQFEALGDSSKPNYLQYPATVTELNWFKYDNRASASDTKVNYTEIEYVSPEDFLKRIEMRDSSASNVTSVSDTSGVTFLVRTDLNPSYWTTFDDEYIVCDSYNSSIDNTLQKSKSQGYGKVEPTFTLSDSFIPDMDVDVFPLLLSTAKAIAFVNMKQQNNPAASAISRRHIVRHQNNRHRLKKANEVNYPNYGRK